MAILSQFQVIVGLRQLRDQEDIILEQIRLSQSEHNVGRNTAEYRAILDQRIALLKRFKLESQDCVSRILLLRKDSTAEETGKPDIWLMVGMISFQLFVGPGSTAALLWDPFVRQAFRDFPEITDQLVHHCMDILEKLGVTQVYFGSSCRLSHQTKRRFRDRGFIEMPRRG